MNFIYDRNDLKLSKSEEEVLTCFKQFELDNNNSCRPFFATLDQSVSKTFDLNLISFFHILETNSFNWDKDSSSRIGKRLNCPSKCFNPIYPNATLSDPKKYIVVTLMRAVANVMGQYTLPYSIQLYEI